MPVSSQSVRCRLATRSSLKRGGVYGAVTGLWWTSHSWLLDRWARSGWPSLYPEELRHGFAEILGLSSSLGIAAGFSFGFPVLFTVWALLERSTRMDPQQHAWAAIRWAGRHLMWPLVVFVLGTLALIAIVQFAEAEGLLLFVLLPAVLVAMLAPFAILRVDVVSAPYGGRWWVPRWPGIVPLGTAVGVGLIVALVGVLLGSFRSAGGELLGASSKRGSHQASCLLWRLFFLCGLRFGSSYLSMHRLTPAGGLNCRRQFSGVSPFPTTWVGIQLGCSRRLWQ